MFSCCRANPKNLKNDKCKKNATTTTTDEQNNDATDAAAAANDAADGGVVATDANDGKAHNEAPQQNEAQEAVAPTTSKNVIDKSDAAPKAETAVTTAAAIVQLNGEIGNDDDDVDGEGDHRHHGSDESNIKRTQSHCNDAAVDGDVRMVQQHQQQLQQPQQECNKTNHNNNNNGNSKTANEISNSIRGADDGGGGGATTTGGGGSGGGGDDRSSGHVADGTVAPRSCLSRHNSTHTSIKKKVNISNRAEIIEPEPLPPPLLPEYAVAAAAAGALEHTDALVLEEEEDDVFSDSLPPPKRESMCAPYIERDSDDELPLEAHAHGLPEWFNERFSEIGCIEPPVTPVGRDELELRHQRLYAELLRAAHAAVRFSATTAAAAAPHDNFISKNFDFISPAATAATTFTGEGGETINGLVNESATEAKSVAAAAQLEYLVERLERIVDRLEHSINAREQQQSQQQSNGTTSVSQFNQPTDDGESDQHNHNHQNHQEENSNDSPLPLPTPSPPPPPPPPLSPTDNNRMSVLGYQDIVSGPLAQYLQLSAKIGGDVAKHAEFVKLAFDAQLQYVTLATQCAQPSQDKQMELLKPTSSQISAIQDYREKNRPSPFFNHLSAISESIPALGWVCISPTPGPHVKEMNDAGQFYTNRVLKEWKEKDATHVEWARAWIQTLTELQKYIKQYHTTGLVWSGKGGVPAGSAAPPPPPPIGACPPPPPPPAFDLAAMALDDGDERSALFAEINQGEAITKNLKKVTADMQTHKNPTLRTGPAPFKPTQFGAVSSSSSAAKAPAAKEPVFTRDGKKWLIEYQKNNTGLVVDNAEMNNVIYIFKCENSTVTVKGKVNNIVLDSCKKCSLLFDSVVASIEFVNCQSVQMQVLGFVPTISIDKTDGCQMYLSKESLGVEIVSSKSSEMNVMLPENSGDYTELALPEQYKTTIAGKTLKTVCVDSLG